MKTLVPVLVAALGLGLLGTFLLQDHDAASTQTRSDRATTGSPSASTSPTTSPSSSPSPTTSVSATGIETTSLFYFGRPFETILIPGTYHGVEGAAALQLQLLRKRGWTRFPLPVVTQPSGEFRAFVELGPGEYRLRLVDPESGTKSKVLTLLLL